MTTNEQGQQLDSLRCLISGNLCGTDTIADGSEPDCANCDTFRQETAKIVGTLKGLLPCPFCGSPAAIVMKYRGWTVYCENRFNPDICPVNARAHYGDTEQEAITAWNTRAESPLLSQAIIALKEVREYLMNSKRFKESRSLRSQISQILVKTCTAKHNDELCLECGFFKMEEASE
jgi:hypothetical protein